MAESRPLRTSVLGAAGLVVGVAAWWVLAAVLAPRGTLLSRFGPGDALPALWTFLGSEVGIGHTLDTLRRLAVGLGIAISLGVAVGFTVGLSRTAASASSWLFQFLRMISPLAWTPIAVAAFGIGDPPVYFLVAVAAIWPVVLSTAAGVAAVEPGWVSVARSLDASGWEVVRHVYAPGVRSHLGTGIRLALGTAWIVIVPAEMLGVDSGLGYAILDARDRLAYPELMAVIVWIGLLGTLIDVAVRRATDRRRPGRTRRPSPPANTPPVVTADHSPT